MSDGEKRWYDIALENVFQLLAALPADKQKLHETLRTDVKSVTQPLLRIDTLMDLLKKARHDVPKEDRARVHSQIGLIRDELRRFIARTQSIGNDIN